MSEVPEWVCEESNRLGALLALQQWEIRLSVVNELPEGRIGQATSNPVYLSALVELVEGEKLTHDLIAHEMLEVLFSRLRAFIEMVIARTPKSMQPLFEDMEAREVEPVIEVLARALAKEREKHESS